MLSLTTPCESPAHSVWHLVSGVATLSGLWAVGVVAVQWCLR